MSVRAPVSSGDPVTSDISRSPQAPCPPTNSQVTALHHDLAAPLADRDPPIGRAPGGESFLALTARPSACHGPECARPARAGDRPRRLDLPLQDAHVVDIAGEGVALHRRPVAARLPADCQLPRVRDRAARAGQRFLADAVDDYCHRVRGAITPDRVPRTIVDLRRGEDGPLLIVSA